jgi:hypothetical protein
VPTSVTLKEHIDWLGRLDEAKVTQGLRRGLISAGLRMIQEIVTREIPARVPMPVDRGVYRAGWKLDSTSEIAVFNDVLYADKIEGGIQPGELQRTPELLEQITAWVGRKQLAQQGQSARAVAWRIVSALIRNGVYNRGEGLGIMAAVVNDGRLDSFIQEECAAEVEKLFTQGAQ